MNDKTPWEIHPGLTLDRLLFVAQLINAVHEEVARHIQPSKGDKRFGRWVQGTTEYARVADTIIKASESGKYPWLGIVDPGMQFTAAIDNVPFRIYHGDTETPTRSARKQSVKEQMAQTEAFDLNLITRPDAGWAWRMAVEPDPAVGGALNITFVEVSSTGAYRNPFAIPFRENVAALSSVAPHRPAGVDLPPPLPQEMPAAEETGTEAAKSGETDDGNDE